MIGRAGPRHTGRGIVVQDGKILLMERWRDDLHYFSIPGGGIEALESPEQAAVREIAEETSVQVTIVKEILQLIDAEVKHHIFLCKYISGRPHLPKDSEEAKQGAKNRFEPCWFDLKQVEELPFLYWQPIKQPLLTAISNDFEADIAIVRVGSTA
ncbi:MAG: NUDIX domain-containing protein [Patescibacteria group bacterium]|nr:NUDIX domain-containing protein [Patescibacteria group bacterium]